MPKASARRITTVYQLKITLRESKPPIWRRVLVPGNFTLDRVHAVIQRVMGWQDYHLHQFTIGDDYYADPSMVEDEPVIDERRTRLETVATYEKFKFLYEYDFGDGWEHTILVEKILLPEPDVTYPVCVAGKRACPPEDVGGMWGYEDFLDALGDPEREEHAAIVEWAGGAFDPEAWDIDAVNEALKTLK